MIVTVAMPEGIQRFGQMSGIWICDPASVIALTAALRFHVRELAHTRGALLQRDEKMAAIYAYVASPQFRNRVESMV